MCWLLEGRYSDLGLCGRPTPGVVCGKAGIQIDATAEITVKTYHRVFICRIYYSTYYHIQGSGIQEFQVR